FLDRFGPIPPTVSDLFYQTKVKVMAESKGLDSIVVEAEQIVLHYPSLVTSESTFRQLPSLGHGCRAGRNAYWLSQTNPDDAWKERLLTVLKLIPSVDETVGVHRAAPIVEATQ
ncbi:hypothetical protein EG832_18255, partial [bacterium]|nr:hypothetical protein [bacterium]